MNYLYKLVTTKNVEINYDAFKKKELVECLATMRDIYFRLQQENQQLKEVIDKTKEAIQNMMHYGYFVSNIGYFTPQNEDTLFGVRAIELLKILENKEV